MYLQNGQHLKRRMPLRQVFVGKDAPSNDGAEKSDGQGPSTKSGRRAMKRRLCISGWDLEVDDQEANTREGTHQEANEEGKDPTLMPGDASDDQLDPNLLEASDVDKVSKCVRRQTGFMPPRRLRHRVRITVGQRASRSSSTVNMKKTDTATAS